MVLGKSASNDKDNEQLEASNYTRYMKSWKHISIFVSSTFKDMDVERDALRTFVEPRINKYLERYMLSIEFIDLRHTVKTDKELSEEERERQICSVCLKEIDRSSPYFIGLLGHRHGWIPPEGIIDNPCDNVFCIEAQYLSVTSHEYIRGLFMNPQRARGCVFLRKESSYRNLSPDTLPDYIDNGKNLELVNTIRDHLAKSDTVKTIDYDLDLGKICSKSISDWVELAYQAIVDLVSPECNTCRAADELHEFISAQEHYVQNRLMDFRGREKELEECMKKIEQRNGCIIAETEYGLGMHSLICKIYDIYRHSADNVCLFYTTMVQNELSSFHLLLYYWNWYLNAEYFADEPFSCPKEDENAIENKFNEYIDALTNQGKRVCAFICGELKNLPKALHSDKIQLCCLMLYTPESNFIRPSIYMVEPYRIETVAKIIEPLRPAVRARLLKHPCCQKARWLNIAKNQLDRMDKMDYLIIRSKDETDKEQNIVNYQLDMIDEFPYDANELLVRWHMKIREFLGHDIVDKILYTIGIAEYGISASACCQIVGCEMIEFSIICHALGQYIVHESDKSFLYLDNMDVFTTTLDVMSAEDKKIINVRFGSNPASVKSLSEIKLKIHMLSDDINGFVCMLGDCTSRDKELNETLFVNDFIWMACHMPLDFKRFISRLTETETYYPYHFFNNLLTCIKYIHSCADKKIYHSTLSMTRNWLVNLWEKGIINSKSHNILGDIIYCEADFYYEQGNYKEYFDTIDYGFMLSANYMTEYPYWAKSYLYYLYKKIEHANPDVKFEILKKRFITLEKHDMISIPEDDDPTIYGIILMETCKHYAAAGNDMAAYLADKSLGIFIDIVERRAEDDIETPLQLVDTIRNLLYNMHITLYLYENSNKSIISKDWVLQKGKEAIEKCKIHKDIYKNDISLYYYYDILGRLTKFSSGTIEEKIAILYDHIFEIQDDEDIDYISYSIKSRNTPMTTYDFAAYINLMSQILFLLSLIKTHKCLSTERIENKKTSMKPFVKREEYLCFKNELQFILPLIGAKQRDADGLMPQLLKTSMISIYSSMINVELKKEDPDGRYIKRLLNSCEAEIGKVFMEYMIPYSLYVHNEQLFTEIIEEYDDEECLYDNFDDCFGVPGDIYVSPNGMWANGDPSFMFTLEIIDTPNEYTWSREELEDKIINEDYEAIIDMFHGKERLSVYEAYYLGLALMRTHGYEDSFNVMDALMLNDLPEDVISDGEVFSVITNFLISCLLSNHIEEYKKVYSQLNPEDYLDEDIIEIHEAYKQFLKDGNLEIRLPEPYGYMI